MQNTKTEYSSSERTPVVLPEMEQLLPPLSGEQFSALENNILENGCYAPIIVNEDIIIIDVHNRFRICEKHGLSYKMLVFSFTDLLEAKQWALDTQKGRRNLDKWELGKIALKLKPEIEARAKANQGARTDLSVNSPKSCSPTDTRKEMARAVGIGEQTMGRIAQLTENAPQSLKDALENKEVSINRGWRILKAVQQLPPEEQEPIVAEMLSAVREIDQLDAEADRRHKIAGLFCKAYERAVLLTSTKENVRIWTECTHMTQEGIEDSVQESYELAQTFQTIGDLLKNAISCVNQWPDAPSDKGQGVMCNTLLVHISGYCFGKGVCVDTLTVNRRLKLSGKLSGCCRGKVISCGPLYDRRGHKMNVKFSFDEAIVERRDFTLEDVHRTIKTLFAAHDFPCVFEGDVLSFTDKGHGDDFAVMWDIILSLLRSDWFVECAAPCVWQGKDGEEDILSQARKV